MKNMSIDSYVRIPRPGTVLHVALDLQTKLLHIIWYIHSGYAYKEFRGYGCTLLLEAAPKTPLPYKRAQDYK